MRIRSTDHPRELHKIPVSIFGSGPKAKTICITAGMDGDEYASIEAAYALIKKYSGKKLNGRMIIIPIANLPGFKTRQSKNPADGKYPKYILPGKRTGSSSERLMFHLFEKYIKNSSVWVDLHGGAITEFLKPYFYAYKTKNKAVNKTVDNIFKYLKAEKAFLGKPELWEKTEFLAKYNLAYLLLESGFAGRRDSISINKHIEWVETILKVLKIFSARKSEPYPKRIYTKISEYMPKESGLWYPAIEEDLGVKKGQKIGDILSLEGKLIEEVITRVDGEILWVTKGMPCEKNVPLFEIGYN
ncbi:MAG: succinylglutamate desuccinylase/aspartoacylase family protein [Patescibacteria group bacterium]|nr:succinylglutamate desuccinylase/aspartoacylase family protein [Patescibacteria group bacterium]